jgi:pimeloyl-ACP methyl ester carboxylesterase
MQTGIALSAALVLTLQGSLVSAQIPAWATLDSTRNNLVYPAGYQAAAPGALGRVVRLGSGPRDVVLIAGWGFDAALFEPFMRQHAGEYRMVAVTLPGFGGTPGLPLPAAGTSYGEQAWTRAAEDAVARLIEDEDLERPIVVGHFVTGTQVALRLGLNHPDRVGGIVSVGGLLYAPFPSRRDSTGKTPAGLEERVGGVDRFWGPRWYKFVTEETWRRGNYQPEHYSVDLELGRRRVAEAEQVLLPVLIQYISEFFASDLSLELPRLRVPVVALVPGFSPAVMSDSAYGMTAQVFAGSWRPALDHPGVRVITVDGSGVFITDDQPAVFARAVAELAGTLR